MTSLGRCVNAGAFSLEKGIVPITNVLRLRLIHTMLRLNYAKYFKAADIAENESKNIVACQEKYCGMPGPPCVLIHVKSIF